MSTEPVVSARSSTRLRADQPRTELASRTLGAWLIAVALGAVFVLVGGASLELGEFEARLGLSAAEKPGPYGQVFGGWEPGLLPGQVLPSVAWSWFDGRIPTAGLVRWPAALAGLAIGLLLGRRVAAAFGSRALVLWSLCWFGSLALMDRSSGAAHFFEGWVAQWLRSLALYDRSPGLAFDLITGLATVAALDRIIARGAGWVAGLWTALAVVSGGWPSAAVVGLAVVMMGRRGSSHVVGLLLPPLAAFAAWSWWAMSAAPAEAWAAALTLPLTGKSAWLLVPGVLVLGLPWSPFAALALQRRVRESWPPAGRALAAGWLQVAGVSLLLGTFVPGLGPATRVPALAGLAICAAACLDHALSGGETGASRPAFLRLATAVVVAWFALVLRFAIPVVSEVSWYRTLAILVIVVSALAVMLLVGAFVRRDARRAAVAVATVAACLKLAHWGYVVPEWNYRFGQGPWGRAIGQWVIPRGKIYTEHAWPPELAFAIGRPVRQIASPRHLPYQPGPDPKFVLLLDGELEKWPKEAPALVVVARFQDGWGHSRVLARTHGDASWRRLARVTRDE